MSILSKKKTVKKPVGKVVSAQLPPISPLSITGIKRATFIDWLQATVTVALAPNGQVAQFSPCSSGGLFSIELKSEKGSQNFKRIYHIYTTKHNIVYPEPTKVASLELEPRSSIIAQDIAILKIDNLFLYSSELEHLVSLLLTDFGFTFKHWTRVDICMDFQELELYSSPDPEQFLADYDSGVIKIKGSKNAKKDKEESEVSSLQVNKNGQMYKAITWGCYATGKKITMYNKSLEMRQRSDKPWIRQNWEINGFNEKKDTWRIEFSIRKNLEEIYDRNELANAGGVLDHLDSLSLMVFELIRPENYQKFFNAFYHKHFQFAHNEFLPSGRKKQFCRCKPAPVFSVGGSSLLLARFSEKKKSANMEKYYIKKLIETVRAFNERGIENTSRHTLIVIADKVYQHNIQRWFEDKYPDIDLRRWLTVMDRPRRVNYHQLLRQNLNEDGTCKYNSPSPLQWSN